jgi:peroxiredoxin
LINLHQAIRKMPAIIIFYRGGWYPYWAKHLARLQDIRTDLDELGYQLIAISTDSPENKKATREKEKLSFTLLSDADLAFAKSPGIAYKAPAVYDKFLQETSGRKNTDKLLPVPSVFIIDGSATIQFEHITPDFRQRMSPALLRDTAAAFAKQ